jgi:mono/diheme cytochrome c family protein
MRFSSLLALSLSLLMLAGGRTLAQTTRSTPPPRQAASPSLPPAEYAMPRGNAEHGRYLAEHVAMCVECHSPRDENGNIIEGEQYLGAELPLAVPSGWAQRAPRNRGLAGYSDEMAMRLLTQGAIGRDGRRLRPPMPRFRMSPQDAADVIAFLRSF